MKETDEITSKLLEEEKVKVYYAEEGDGLHTDPARTDHAQLIDMSGGKNVAEVEIKSGYGRAAVSIEQVIKWNPEVIIACIDSGYSDSSSYKEILSSDKWKDIDAVKNKFVFETPTAPHNWFDRPPSVNTVIGIRWVQSILYPDKIDYDLKKETKEFYLLFYNYDLTDSEYKKITNKSLGEIQ